MTTQINDRPPGEHITFPEVARPEPLPPIEAPEMEPPVAGVVDAPDWIMLAVVVAAFLLVLACAEGWL